MVIERFKSGCYASVYERYHKAGRLLPDGLHYLNSWRTEEGNKQGELCFQLMETSDYSLFAEWTAKWSDLVEFEIYALAEDTQKS